MNIGIASAIWAVNPFMITTVEWIFYKQKFVTSQIFGMLLMILCAVIVSLSEIVVPAEVSKGFVSNFAIGNIMLPPEEQPSEKKLPVWAAVLFSFIMPCVCTVFFV